MPRLPAKDRLRGTANAGPPEPAPEAASSPSSKNRTRSGKPTRVALAPGGRSGRARSTRAPPDGPPPPPSKSGTRPRKPRGAACPACGRNFATSGKVREHVAKVAQQCRVRTEDTDAHILTFFAVFPKEARPPIPRAALQVVCELARTPYGRERIAAAKAFVAEHPPRPQTPPESRTPEPEEPQTTPTPTLRGNACPVCGKHLTSRCGVLSHILRAAQKLEAERSEDAVRHAQFVVRWADRLWSRPPKQRSPLRRLLSRRSRELEPLALLEEEFDALWSESSRSETPATPCTQAHPDADEPQRAAAHAQAHPDANERDEAQEAERNIQELNAILESQDPVEFDDLVRLLEETPQFLPTHSTPRPPSPATSPLVAVFTDGSFSDEDGAARGGIGVVFPDGREISARVPGNYHTPLRAEILAACAACLCAPANSRLTIATDCRVLANWWLRDAKGYERPENAIGRGNGELWCLLLRCAAGLDLSVLWVKAHTDGTSAQAVANARADELAKAGLDQPHLTQRFVKWLTALGDRKPAHPTAALNWPRVPDELSIPAAPTASQLPSATCPTCGKVCALKRGLSSHIARSHPRQAIPVSLEPRTRGEVLPAQQPAPHPQNEDTGVAETAPPPAAPSELLTRKPLAWVPSSLKSVCDRVRPDATALAKAVERGADMPNLEGCLGKLSDALYAALCDHQKPRMPRRKPRRNAKTARAPNLPPGPRSRELTKELSRALEQKGREVALEPATAAHLQVPARLQRREAHAQLRRLQRHLARCQRKKSGQKQRRLKTFVRSLYARDRKAAVARICTVGPQKRCEIPHPVLEEHFRRNNSPTECPPAPEWVADLAWRPLSRAASSAIARDFVPSEIEVALKSRAADSAPGPDGLPYLAWSALPEANTLLARLFTRCLRLGQVPAAWKTSLTTLLHKGGDEADVTRWRPIALANTLGKLFALCVEGRLSAAPGAAGALAPMQKGFRPCDGATEHVHTLLSALEDAKASNRRIFGAFVDLKGAFGSVPHTAIAGLCAGGAPAPIPAARPGHRTRPHTRVRASTRTRVVLNRNHTHPAAPMRNRFETKHKLTNRIHMPSTRNAALVKVRECPCSLLHNSATATLAPA
eukprot:gnl/Chilomastix_cuspidata/721.p1 GENE.gnl/Chilomastix_cuspidata/721~~gnl/Chilomastix_cuspidata/721.p1  ORF type:complete len:1111 (+),score=229.50 gnl/Chilomastix_cuspidata/721:2526-5858(+)